MPVTQLRKDVARALNPILEWALTKTPAARFINVAAFARTEQFRVVGGGGGGGGR